MYVSLFISLLDPQNPLDWFGFIYSVSRFHRTRLSSASTAASLSQTDLGNVECLKTCCGALAILAKDESNKLLIARDGTRLILTVMEGHATRPDLQASLVRWVYMYAIHRCWLINGIRTPR